MLLTYRTEDGRMPAELKRVVDRPSTSSIRLEGLAQQQIGQLLENELDADSAPEELVQKVK